MKLILSLLVLTYSLAANADTVYDNPRVDVNGVSHKIVYKDKETNTIYWDAEHGFCKLVGHEGSSGAAARNGYEGPYAFIDRSGAVISTSEAHPDLFYRLSVLTSVYCR